MEERARRYSTMSQEESWIIRIKDHIQSALQENQHHKEFINASIFYAPKMLSKSKPDAFIPHMISLGPLHHDKDELFDTERYKIMAVQRFITRCKENKRPIEFHTVVESFYEVDTMNRIRSHYHSNLQYGDDALSLMMALDACFLLEFLLVVSDPGKRPGFLLRSSMLKAVQKDVLMFENQIPLFLLHRLLEFEVGSSEIAMQRLQDLANKAIHTLSPFATSDSQPCNADIKNCSHLLQVLYNATIPASLHQIIEDDDESVMDEPPIQSRKTSHSHPRKSSQRSLIEMRNEVNMSDFMASTLDSASYADESGWTPPSNPKPFVFTTRSSTTSTQGEGGDEEGMHYSLPRATELSYVGIKLESIIEKGGLDSLIFDEKTRSLHVPRVCLDHNIEVVLPNLMAYEMVVEPTNMVISRFVDFMVGIAHTAVDVRLLRKRGILSNHMKDDDHVSTLWKDLAPRYRLPKVWFLDDVISRVKLVYKRRLRWKVGHFAKRYLVSSWHVVCIFAGMFFLLLTGIQTAFTVYNYAQLYFIRLHSNGQLGSNKLGL